MMDMWNWLQNNYNANQLNLYDLKETLKDRRAALRLWKDFLDDEYIVDFVRDEVGAFVKHIEAKIERKNIADGKS